MYGCTLQCTEIFLLPSRAKIQWGHGGRVVTLSPPTSEFLARPQVGKLVVACHWLQFTVQNLDQLYVLVSSTLPTTHRDMTCTVLKVT